MLRGINQQLIFEEDEDMQRFIDTLKRRQRDGSSVFQRRPTKQRKQHPKGAAFSIVLRPQHNNYSIKIKDYQELKYNSEFYIINM